MLQKLYNAVFFYILWGTHGDHPAIVLSASTVRECYDLTIKSFNFSEKFRTPVVLLIDEVVAHMREKMVLSEEEEVETFYRIKPTVPPEWYIPYEDTPSGIPAPGGRKVHTLNKVDGASITPEEILNRILEVS